MQNLKNIANIRDEFLAKGWFKHSGAHVLFDGQFGSTGKGLLASVMALALGDRMNVITTNAGPNSGHTAYFGDEKIMTQQLPVASVFAQRLGHQHLCYLNGGAVIDPEILAAEVARYGVRAVVHPHAAIIDDKCREAKLAHIASTGKGVGPAMSRKLLRYEGYVAQGHAEAMSEFAELANIVPTGRVFIETAQGFSLGINSGFYPHVTSRECTVGQALADARMSPKSLQRSIVSLRTYPIRVGNLPEGHSGGWYPDQRELTWDEIGQAPELTTVTKRVRRVATFSFEQFAECLRVNEPDAFFLNFCNYLSPLMLEALLYKMLKVYRVTLGRDPEIILLGFGPRAEDVVLGTVIIDRVFFTAPPVTRDEVSA